MNKIKIVLGLFLFLIIAVVATVYIKKTQYFELEEKYESIGLTLSDDLTHSAFKKANLEYEVKYQELQTQKTYLNESIKTLNKQLEFSSLKYENELLLNFDTNIIDYTNIDIIEKEVEELKVDINSFISDSFENNINQYEGLISQSPSKTANPKDNDLISVSTFNVLNKYNAEYAGSWEQTRLNQNCATINDSNSDIIVINEAVDGTIEELSNCTRYNYVHYGATGLLYDPVLFNVVDIGGYHYNTQEGKYEPRVAIYTIFEYGDKTISVIASHFDTDYDFATMQTKETIVLDNYLNNKYDIDNSFFAGDVNYELESEFCNSGAITYKSDPKSIDRVCSKTNYLGSEVITTSGSDHNLVKGDFILQ